MGMGGDNLGPPSVASIVSQLYPIVFVEVKSDLQGNGWQGIFF